MSNPLYVALGFTKVEIATVAKIYGVIATLAGVAIGGIMVLRLGIFRALLIGGVLQALSNLMYIVQVWAGHDVAVLALTIGTENLTNGMGSAAFVAYLSGLCNVAFTATQYALLSSLATVGVNILSASGGWLADELGWVEFFLVSTGADRAGPRAAGDRHAPSAARAARAAADRRLPGRSREALSTAGLGAAGRRRADGEQEQPPTARCQAIQPGAEATAPRAGVPARSADREG